MNNRNEDSNQANDVDFVALTGDIIQGSVPLGGMNPSEMRDTAYYTVHDEWKFTYELDVQTTGAESDKCIKHDDDNDRSYETSFSHKFSESMLQCEEG